MNNIAPFIVLCFIAQTADASAPSKRLSTVCSQTGATDIVQITDKTQLKLPSNVKLRQAATVPPWHRPGVQVWNSTMVTRRIEALLDRPLPCFKPAGTTYRQIFTAMQQRFGCWVFLFGGSVRDAIRGTSDPSVLTDLDTETSCTLDEAFDACRQLYGSSQCWRSPLILHLGGSRQLGTYLDMAAWDDTLYGDGSGLEYSVNSIAYDLTQHVIIDVTGLRTGVSDVCRSKIKIPILASLEHTDAVIRESWFQKNDVIRFWKMRSRGYDIESGDNTTLNFVTSKVEEMLTTPIGRAKLQKKCCRYAWDGRFFEGSSICLTERKDTSAEAAQFYRMLEHDFLHVGKRQLWLEQLEPLLKRDVKVERGKLPSCLNKLENAI